jgi:hypothetical protein
MPITPSTKMKQLQWDKLPQTQVTKTFWNAEQPDQETLIIQKLQRERVWLEMEEDFKAKQLVINLMARQKRAELKSVLDAQTKKRVGKCKLVSISTRIVDAQSRNLDPGCQKAGARRNCFQDSAV